MGVTRMSKTVEKENEGRREPTVDEMYRWVGTLKEESVRRTVYTAVRFINGLLASLEVTAMSGEQGTPSKTLSISITSNEPEDYFEAVMEFVQKILQKLELIQEDYEMHTFF